MIHLLIGDILIPMDHLISLIIVIWMSIIELRVCGRYKLGPKIGVGTYGSIYLAKNVQSNNDVAIKIEEVKSKHPQLLFEGKILQNL